MNLFSYDLVSKETKQLTDFKDFDIKFPSLGEEAIVFEKAGYIWRFDLATDKARQVPIAILEDRASGRAGTVDASKNIDATMISPDGKRALFGARGDVFTVPAKDGPTRNLTNTPGVHERNANWSPDGKWIAYVSDATGENEFWVRPQDGRAPPVQLTTKADTYKYGRLVARLKKMLWSDNMQRLRYVDVETKEVTQVDQDKLCEIRDFTWSPDSKWIAYARPEDGLAAENLALLARRARGGSR